MTAALSKSATTPDLGAQFAQGQKKRMAGGPLAALRRFFGANPCSTRPDRYHARNIAFRRKTAS